MTSASTPASPSKYQFAIRDIVNSIVDEYARKHKPGAGQLGLFENPAERQKPLFSKKVDDEAGKWVTMRGARVFISGEDGRIMKGPKALMGKTKEQIERESAGKEGGGDRKPKPKPLNEMGKISGGRKENRQQKLFEELNPGFTFVDDGDDEEDFKVVEPMNFEEALKSDFEQAISEVPSSPAEKLTRPEWDQKVRDDIRSIMGEMDYDNADIDRMDGIDAIDRAVSFAYDSNRGYEDQISALNDKWIDSMPENLADEEPSFTLDSTPQHSPAKPPAFGNPDATPTTKQGALFDTGKNTKDLKGQELLFNSDAGDVGNERTMENRVKQDEVSSKSEAKLKEPWEMTKSEFRKHIQQNEGPKGQRNYGITDSEVNRNMAWWDEHDRLQGEMTGTEILDDPWGHRKIIESAISAGKPVSPEVLADYPDLAKPKPESSPPPAKKKSAEKPSASSIQSHLDNDDHESAFDAFSKLKKDEVDKVAREVLGIGFYNKSKAQMLESLKRTLPLATKTASEAAQKQEEIDYAEMKLRKAKENWSS